MSIAVVSSLTLLCCCVLVAPPVSSQPPVTAQISLNLSFSNASLDVRFLSICLEFFKMATFCDTNSTSMQIFRKLTAALTPAELRLGGSSSNFMTFYPSENSCPRSKRRRSAGTRSVCTASPLFNVGLRLQKIRVTGDQWSRFQYFVENSGDLKLLFNANIMKFLRNGQWDPTNTDQYLQFSSARKFAIPFFQIANEPYSYPYNYNVTVDPLLLVKSFQKLKELVKKYPLYKDSKFYGPDVTNINVRDWRWGNKEYMKSFLAQGGCQLIEDVSFHHYYSNNNRVANSSDMMNATVLDSFATILQATLKAIGQSCNRTIGLRLTETSSVAGGGLKYHTDRFVAGFMWLDKLGTAAKYGLTRVYRQALIGASYSLIDGNLIFPYPDYYLSVLYKKLVAGPVILASTNPPNPKLRVYGNCARNLKYSPGAVVLYFLNLGTDVITLSFSEFPRHELEAYVMTPAPDAVPLQSRIARLNGIDMKLNGAELPRMDPVTTTGEVSLAAESYGFIVIPGANAKLCTDHYST